MIVNYVIPPILLNLFDHEHEQNEKETKRRVEIWGLAQCRMDMLPVNPQLSRAQVVTSAGVMLSLRQDPGAPS